MSDMKTKRLESGEVIPPGYFGELWDDINARTLSGDSKTVRVTRTPNGTTISAIPAPAPAPSASVAYSGYFKVINASSGSGESRALKVKVVDGAAPDSGFCGHATFNDTHFEVPVQDVTVTATGFLFLKSTMGVEDPPLPMAPEFEFLTAWPDAEDSVGRRLIATVKAGNNALTITQQQHGEVQAFIWGDC